MIKRESSWVTKFAFVQAALVVILAGSNATALTDEQYLAQIEQIISEVARPASIEPEDWEIGLQGFRALASENKAFVFAGEVVDRHGIGIEGVEVQGTIESFNPAALAAFAAGDNTVEEFLTEPWSRTTDASGRFEVQGRGLGAWVRTVEKADFEGPPGFVETHFAKTELMELADAGTRPQWVLWRTSEIEPTETREVRLTGAADGAPRHVNLLVGSEVSGSDGSADLTVSLRSAAAGTDVGSKYRWSLQLSCPEECLVEAPSWGRFVAPAEGYARTWRFTMSELDPVWRMHADRAFYFKGRGGAFYARLEVSGHAFGEGHMTVRIRGELNPSASRNLFPAE